MLAAPATPGIAAASRPNAERKPRNPAPARRRSATCHSLQDGPPPRYASCVSLQ